MGCHDVGHPGVNNPFLVETSHELAIRYNDNSPLENMHCAKLFEIANQQKTAVFADLDKVQYKEVRKVCIEAILHTDNMHHFTMVSASANGFALATKYAPTLLMRRTIGLDRFLSRKLRSKRHAPRQVCRQNLVG